MIDEACQLSKAIDEMSAIIEQLSLENQALRFQLEPPPPPELNGRYLEVYTAVADFWHDNGYAPSNDDIVTATSITSKSVVFYYLYKLQKLGFIKRDPGIARSTRIAK